MQEETLVRMFRDRVKRYGDRVCLRHKAEGAWRDISWKEFGERVDAFAMGLISLELEPGQCVSVLSTTRPEWAVADLGILSARGRTVGIYPSNPPKDVEYLLSHSEAAVVVVENPDQLEKVLSVRERLPALRKIVVIEGLADTSEEDLFSLDAFLELGRSRAEKLRDELEARVAAARPDEIATCIYTSGTTGPPKGALITHGNVLFNIEATKDRVPLADGDEYISFLPLAHLLERFIFYATLFHGVTINYAESFERLGANLLEIRPTALIGVPRVYEKIYDRVVGAAEAAGALKGALFRWAVSVGRKYAVLTTEKQPVPAGLRMRRALADRLVFSKMRERVGGRIKWLGSGGAPLSRSIAEFFHAAGLPIFEAYGLTESSAPATCHAMDDYRFGTVGKPIPGVDVKIADDGEILIRGPNVFAGYFKEPEATAEAIRDGWLYSGDVGVFDADGFLKITDRKKDLIITAGGKNIAPQNIENLMKISKYISHIMVYGDRKPYCVALVTLNLEEVRPWAETRGIPSTDEAELARHPEVRKLIQGVIDEKNRELVSVETVKKFRILESDFSEETGEITPTMKVKRKFTSNKYMDIIEKMYDESK